MAEELTLFGSNKPLPPTIRRRTIPLNNILSIISLARRSNNRLLSRHFLRDIKLKYSRTHKTGNNILNTRTSRLETHTTGNIRRLHNTGSKTTLTHIRELQPL
jgi:hypothetical protein